MDFNPKVQLLHICIPVQERTAIQESRVPKGEEWQHPAGNNRFGVLGQTPRFFFFLFRVRERPGWGCK